MEITTNNDTISPKLFPAVCSKTLPTFSDPIQERKNLKTRTAKYMLVIP